jgi:hypothetical protein
MPPELPLLQNLRQMIFTYKRKSVVWFSFHKSRSKHLTILLGQHVWVELFCHLELVVYQFVKCHLSDQPPIKTAILLAAFHSMVVTSCDSRVFPYSIKPRSRFFVNLWLSCNYDWVSNPLERLLCPCFTSEHLHLPFLLQSHIVNTEWRLRPPELLFKYLLSQWSLLCLLASPSDSFESAIIFH